MALGAPLLLFSAMLTSGCDIRGPSLLASFESRCAALPAPRYQVRTAPFEVTEDDTQDVAALTARSGASSERHRTMGLTVSNFGHETDSRLRLLEERSSGRACATPEVEIVLSMQPTTVYVARELAHDACQHEATRQHELRHVAAYRELLDEARDRLAADLPATLQRQALSGSSATDVRVRFEAVMRTYMSDFMRTQHQVLADRQALIDTPEEYARVGNACGPA